MTNVEITQSTGFMGYIRTIFRGSGQVMFQESAWTGLFFLIGIFWGAYAEGSPAVAYGAVVALLVSTFTGYVLNLPATDGTSGLWGFNGILVGCAFPTFLGNTPLMWVGLIVCSMMTVWVRTGFNNLLAPFKINSLTFPFVFSTWIFLFAAKLMQGFTPHLSTPDLVTSFSAPIDLSFISLVIYWLKGIAQVFLINSWVTGIFFLVGLFICSRWAAMWAAVASALALAVALLFQADGTSIANGLYAFSPVLTGIALGCTFYKPNCRTAIWTIIGIIVTVFVQAGMNSMMLPFGLPTLTAPFCVATWLFLLPLYKFDDKDPNHSDWFKKKVTK